MSSNAWPPAVLPPAQSYESVATPPSDVSSRSASFSSVSTYHRGRDDEFHQPPNKWVTRFFGLPGVVGGVVVGIALGGLLYHVDTPGEVVTWIGTPGRLFIRALECLVSPLVFCGLVVSMTDMALLEHARSIGVRTLGCYLLTTAVATLVGVSMSIAFGPAFQKKQAVATETAAAVALQCGEEEGYYIMLSGANGTLSCEKDALLEEAANDTTSATHRFESFRAASALFLQRDLNSTYARTDGGIDNLSLTDALQLQLDALVPDSIVSALAEGTLLSIVMFAVAFGAVLAKGNLRGRFLATTEVIHDLYDILLELIAWVIKCTPVAVCSLLAAAIADSDNLRNLLRSVVLYCTCVICGLLVHTLIFYPTLLRLFVRHKNPFNWLVQMARAQLFALACASSAASLPVVMECVEDTKEVSRGIYHFILPLGAIIGMDGAAVGTPIAIAFMAHVSGVSISGVDYFEIALASAIGSVGVGPVPSTSLVLVMTVWKTVFPSESLPAAFAFITATDWFIDRLHTVVNVTCDTVVCRVVAEQVGDVGLKDAETGDVPVADPAGGH